MATAVERKCHKSCKDNNSQRAAREKDGGRLNQQNDAEHQCGDGKDQPDNSVGTFRRPVSVPHSQKSAG
jgi:hypothetical protein